MPFWKISGKDKGVLWFQHKFDWMNYFINYLKSWVEVLFNLCKVIRFVKSFYIEYFTNFPFCFLQHNVYWRNIHNKEGSSR